MLPPHLYEKVSTDCWCLGSLGRCPTILHVATREWRMACTWFFLIFCSPRLAKSSLPFRGSASVKGNSNILKRPVLPSRIERRNTFLILKFYLSYLSLHSKSPTLLAEPCSRRIILPEKTKQQCTIYRRTSCGRRKFWCQLQTGISKFHPWFPTPHPASCCSCQISKVWQRPRNDVTNCIPSFHWYHWYHHTGSWVSQVEFVQFKKWIVCHSCCLPHSFSFHLHSTSGTCN